MLSMIDYKSFNAYPWKDRSFYARISASVIALGVLIFVAGSLTGMFLAPSVSDTACEQSIGVYNQSNQGLQSALNICLENNKILNDKADSCVVNLTRSNNELAKCKLDLNASNTQNADLAKQVTDLTSKNELIYSTLQNLSSNYSALADNYAQRYCCQLVRWGFNYTGYSVSDNEVSCTATGGITLTC